MSDEEKPIHLVVPPGHESEDKFFLTLFELGRKERIEEFGAFVDIIRAEHWYVWWKNEAHRLNGADGAEAALTNAEAWRQWAVRK
jgi:hypothetical protein